MSPQDENRPRRQLSLADAVSIIVGIIIGAGIFETTPRVASHVDSVTELFLIWSVGGVVTLLGALCFAELAAAYPHAGGLYVYLSRAYGRPMGVLFAWCEFWIVRPGSIGAMAFIFARYAEKLFPAPQEYQTAVLTFYTCASVIVFTVMNLIGVRCGKSTQNVLTVIKVAGLGCVVIAAFLAPVDVTALDVTAIDNAVIDVAAIDDVAIAPTPSAGGSLAWVKGLALWVEGLALPMIFVFFTYGGWNEIAYAAAEVKRPKVNLPRSLILGSLIVCVVYLIVNWAFVSALGLEGMSASEAVAVDAVTPRLGAWGGRMVSLLVCISCLGAVNGMILTGARIHYALGTEHPLFRFLGRWNATWDAPLWSLSLQCGVTVGLILLVASEEGFDRLVMFTAPVFWTFMCLVGLALMILRWRDRDIERPYRVALYPLTPLLFCVVCGYVVYSSANYLYANWPPEAVWGIGIIVIGVAISFYRTRIKK